MDNREEKNKFWKGVLVGALVMAFAGLIIVGVSSGIFLIGRAVIDNRAQVEQVQGDGTDGENKELNLEFISSKMKYIQGIIDQYFLFDEDTEKVEDGIYTGLMYGLDDPYSVYYNAEQYQSLMESTSGEYCGIGVMVQQNRTTGIITAIKVFANSPAFEAGMLPGDILYQVDGETVTGKDLDLVVKENIRGEEGTYVDITVLRGENAEETPLHVERRSIEVPTVEYQMLENRMVTSMSPSLMR